MGLPTRTTNEGARAELFGCVVAVVWKTSARLAHLHDVARVTAAAEQRWPEGYAVLVVFDSPEFPVEHGFDTASADALRGAPRMVACATVTGDGPAWRPLRTLLRMGSASAERAERKPVQTFREPEEACRWLLARVAAAGCPGIPGLAEILEKVQQLRAPSA